MKRTTLLVAALAAASLAAHAGEMPKLPSYDTDGDGKVSKAEFITAKVAGGKVTAEEAEAKFVKIDTDANGILSEAEYAAAKESWKAGKVVKDPATQ
jgi:hypothetical protein